MLVWRDGRIGIYVCNVVSRRARARDTDVEDSRLRRKPLTVLIAASAATIHAAMESRTDILGEGMEVEAKRRSEGEMAKPLGGRRFQPNRHPPPPVT